MGLDLGLPTSYVADEEVNKPQPMSKDFKEDLDNYV